MVKGDSSTIAKLSRLVYLYCHEALSTLGASVSEL
jgi:hypothetical protein